MPLIVADASVRIAEAGTDKPVFIILYSSIVDGQLWCPDCRVVDSVIKRTFESSLDTTPSAFLIYVGDKPTWKALDNVYRGEPWNISSIPTIVKLKDGKEIGRLVEDEINTGLPEFLAD